MPQKFGGFFKEKILSPFGKTCHPSGGGGGGGGADKIWNHNNDNNVINVTETLVCLFQNDIFKATQIVQGLYALSLFLSDLKCRMHSILLFNNWMLILYL